MREATAVSTTAIPTKSVDGGSGWVGSWFFGRQWQGKSERFRCVGMRLLYRRQQADTLVLMTSGVVGRKSRRGRGHCKFLTKFWRKAANFRQRRLLVLVPNFAFLDENFQTKRRFSYNVLMVHNFGRVSCPLPPLSLPRLCPEFYALREQSVVVALTSTSQAGVVHRSRSGLYYNMYTVL